MATTLQGPKKNTEPFLADSAKDNNSEGNEEYDYAVDPK